MVANVRPLTSKQNSDASGMKYQWGHKDPFTFPTSSEVSGEYWQTGKYPVKIYTIDGVLIYQENNGGSNKDKQPSGGVIYPSTLATSMMETIKTPVTFYGQGINSSVINQTGQTKDLWSYYWTSFSRGTDGKNGNSNWHNDYLNEHISQRLKSIYDPCPYGFKIPSNGIWNQFKIDPKFTKSNYLAGMNWNISDVNSWMLGLGVRNFSSISCYAWTGSYGWYYSSTIVSQSYGYAFVFTVGEIRLNENTVGAQIGIPVRCIEELC